MFTTGDRGKVWAKTLNENSWTVHRDLNMTGQTLSSVITEKFGLNAGMMFEQAKGGVTEMGGIMSAGKKLIPK